MSQCVRQYRCYGNGAAGIGRYLYSKQREAKILVRSTWSTGIGIVWHSSGDGMIQSSVNWILRYKSSTETRTVLVLAMVKHTSVQWMARHSSNTGMRKIWYSSDSGKTQTSVQWMARHSSNIGIRKIWYSSDDGKTQTFVQWRVKKTWKNVNVIVIFLFYLWIYLLSITQVLLRRRTGWLVNKKLGRFWKLAVVT
jgi:hypothetical protein